VDWRVPPVTAELAVDFERIDAYILKQRRVVEARAWPAARRYSRSLVFHEGVPSMRAANELEASLRATVAEVYRFGWEQVQEELARLRRGRLRQAVELPDRPAASYSRQIARQAADAYMAAVEKRYRQTDGDNLDEYARRALHNVALEVVGRALNEGRAIAALGGDKPPRARSAPALFAMRSEQLDKNTCPPCHTVHGTVVHVGSEEFFQYMPPNLCKGRGRCRGIYVYGDSFADFKRAAVLPLAS
jgi:hypothetical protein